MVLEKSLLHVLYSLKIAWDFYVYFFQYFTRVLGNYKELAKTQIFTKYSTISLIIAQGSKFQPIVAFAT